MSINYQIGVGLLLVALVLSCHPKRNSEAVIPDSFAQNCVSCHGNDLKGGVAQSLLDGSWQFGARRNDVFRSIKFGHPSFGMPSWGSSFSDDEIHQMVDYLVVSETAPSSEEKALPKTIETLDYQLEVEVLVSDLEHPWGIAFLDSGRFLVTERPGRLRMVENGILLPRKISGLPDLVPGGQGGLLDVAVDPAYETDPWIYLVLSDGISQDGDSIQSTMTSVVRGRIKDGQWLESQVIYQAPDSSYLKTRIHYGGRIAFDSQGYLYLSIGDRSLADRAQDLTMPNGKVHRLYKDGRIPTSNPFYGQKDKLWTIYSLGHRNPQGLAIHPETDLLWEAEHGPLGGDEVNLVRMGKNYGWPKITYGINYNGQLISNYEKMDSLMQPVWYWTPSIAVSGINFYSGDHFPKWQNQLMVSALRFEEVQLLNIEEDRVLFKQTLLKNYGRVRQVISGPEGAIYVVFDKPGRIARLTRSNDI